MPQSKKITVLMGGWSSEREISLMTGRGVYDALCRLGYEAYQVDMTRDMAKILTGLAPDLVYNALHGSPGEDGSVQGMLDILGMKYTHSGMASSVIAIDKQITKSILMPYAIPMPEGRLVHRDALLAEDPLPRPYVVKPNSEGSSIGVAIIHADSHPTPLGMGKDLPWEDHDLLLVEPYIAGRELTVSVLLDRALEVTELIGQNGFYDYTAKYTENRVQHICPANIPDDIRERCMTYALKAHEILGCKTVSRSDFRWDDRLGVDGLFMLEVNTHPGMTPLSLVPEQAKICGLNYDELVDIIVKDAL